jgi:hypothetical protein
MIGIQAAQREFPTASGAAFQTYAVKLIDVTEACLYGHDPNDGVGADGAIRTVSTAPRRSAG